MSKSNARSMPDRAPEHPSKGKDSDFHRKCDDPTATESAPSSSRDEPSPVDQEAPTRRSMFTVRAHEAETARPPPRATEGADESEGDAALVLPRPPRLPGPAKGRRRPSS